MKITKNLWISVFVALIVASWAVQLSATDRTADQPDAVDNYVAA